MKKKEVKRGEREEEKEENQTGESTEDVTVCLSVEAFEIFSQGRDLESCGGLFLGEKPEDLSDF